MKLHRPGNHFECDFFKAVQKKSVVRNINNKHPSKATRRINAGYKEIFASVHHAPSLIDRCDSNHDPMPQSETSSDPFMQLFVDQIVDCLERIVDYSPEMQLRYQRYMRNFFEDFIDEYIEWQICCLLVANKFCEISSLLNSVNAYVKIISRHNLK